MKTCALVDFLLLLTVFPPCLSRNNVAWSVAHGRFFWPLPDAWVVAVKRREGEHEWRSHGIVAGYSSALTCQYSVKCCAVTACGPPYVCNPAQHRLEKVLEHSFFSPLVLSFDSLFSYERKNLSRRFYSTRSCKRNVANDNELNFLRWSKRLLRKRSLFRARISIGGNEKDWTIKRTVIVLLEVTRFWGRNFETLRKKRNKNWNFRDIIFQVKFEDKG